MERHRQVKMLSIIALVIAIVGMSLGFAAFSTTLSISSSASVNPSGEDFKVVFSSSSTGAETSIIYPTSGEELATPAKVNGLSLSDIHVSFSKPGDYVLYSAYIYNAGKYDAYITDINFGNKTCVAESGTTESLMQKACDDIYIMLAGIGGEYFVSETTVYKNLKIEPGKSMWVEFGVHYPEDSNVADGSFNVTFDDITINVSTVDNPEINFTAYDQYEEQIYNFKAAEGMMWSHWISNNYDDAWAFDVMDDKIACFMGGYLKGVSPSDIIEDGKEYICEYDF